eukprot:TRINITY_DN47353_c0_g1_i1.p1 TRINITY_DN47353_c0_g1~~TRINITY_DN47353_c0_g1_i1.p1  ORF type:complete len:381 (+),score=48.53 TRINITY_DN47353_c0_g1_i1:340-1482(+)
MMDEEVEGASVHAAAEAIAAADWILVAAGAGFSADSGLQTYEQCRESNIPYDDLCRAELLYEEPETAYGFWLGSLRNYRTTPRHEGYDILDRLLGRCSEAGRACIYTSNVDGHFRQSPRVLCYEIHGCCEDWMCSSRVPFRPAELSRVGVSVEVEPADVPIDGTRWQGVREKQHQLLEAAGKACPCARPTPVQAPAGVEWIGSRAAPTAQTQVSGCPGSKLTVPGVDGDVGQKFDWTEFPPQCHCGLPLRPCVLMFGDEDAALLRHLNTESSRYQAWEESMEAACEETNGRLVILEFGVGVRVQVIRQEAEMVFADARARGAKCSLIRVNPADDAALARFLDPAVDMKSLQDSEFIHIKMGALAALRKIEQTLRARQSAT